MVQQNIGNLFLSVSDLITGRNISSRFSHLNKAQYWNREKLLQFQIEQLKKTLTFAVKNVSYFKPILKNFTPNTLGDLVKIPILTKPIIQSQSIENFVYGDINKYIKEGTSGSSGIQGFFYFDKAAQSFTYAAELQFFSWAGFRLGDSHLQTGMTLNRGFLKKVKDIIFRCHYQPAFDLTESKLDSILNIIKSRSLKFLIGYASSLNCIAEYAISNNITIPLRSVISLGDQLFPHYRKNIQSAFNCDVFDTYGCCEGFMVAGQCEHGNYHVPMPLNILEIVDEKGIPVPNGEMGRVVLTRLDKNPMPLIRYDLGDLAVKSKKTRCPCGRGYEILEQIIGRNTDVIKTKMGHKLIVHFFTRIFENIPQIQQFQVTQDDITSINIQYIPGPEFSKNCLSQIEKKILSDCNHDLNIKFNSVKHIPSSPSGKPQLIISNI